ncbi:MAG: hypothetical protein Q7T84_04775 [Phenylobacterium sp.]|uniref:hypothetical protein n=1 Tax=Phenylobacterium sp. TaxID=1871053 RepID=UPI00271E728A|nr:hypothetical protein [Phenylobacterium sp.]MDO9430593.1 hypothetical protein [Phenylobacterium sp.]
MKSGKAGISDQKRRSDLGHKQAREAIFCTFEQGCAGVPVRALAAPLKTSTKHFLVGKKS